MRIRPLLFAAFVVAVFLAPVVVAGSAGVWATTGQQGAGPGGGNGEGSGPAGESGGGGEGTGGGAGNGGDGAGRVVAAGDARGWMTLWEVAEANAIPLAKILAAFDLAPDTDPATALRDVESASFSVAELRAWLAERGAP
jgi:hypothetical protein